MNEPTEGFGSLDMTPDALRRTHFTVQAEGFSPHEVNELLERVASAIEVLHSDSASEALRRELQRNADISARLVLAAQDAAERLRTEAVKDATEIMEETRALSQRLRDQATQEAERSRAHVETLRHDVTEELRDLYDRLGAMLYRIDRAGRGRPERPPVDQDFAEQNDLPATPPEVREDAQPAATTPPAAPAAPSPTESLVTPVHEDDDQPLAEGEPLVDLRPMRASAPAPEREPEPAEPPQTSQPPASESPASESPQASEPAPTSPPESSVWSDESDDDRAEAILQGMDAVLTNMEHASPTSEPVPQPQPMPQPPSLTDTTSDESPFAGVTSASAAPTPPATPEAGARDQEVVQQFVLQSMNDGSPREAIEAYLADQLGVSDPAAMIDQIVGTPPATQ